jgi:hypothetical protein
MSDKENPGFVDQISEDVSTDIILDLKTGIYNLFISLVNNLMIEHGPEAAIKMSTDFLDEVSYNFKSTLPENNQE